MRTRPPEAAELLAAVERSPAAVDAHDRAAWVGLFSHAAQVNDPVGSRPHVGRKAIGKFYDTFIAPNDITFHLKRDVVCGMSVIRDLDLETRMSTGVMLTVPMHLRYDLTLEAGSPVIAGLYAYWELPVMIAQLTRAGWRGALAAAKLTPQLVANQGLAGVTGFMHGLRGVGRAGRRAATGFLVDARGGDVAAMARRLAPGAGLEMPAGTAVSLAVFAENALELRWDKMIMAGRFATVSARSASWVGIVLVEFAARGSGIAAVRVFAEASDGLPH